MMLMVMEGIMTKYPAKQKPPIPARGVFPDEVLVSPLTRRSSSSMRRSYRSSSQRLASGMFGQSASTDVLLYLPLDGLLRTCPAFCQTQLEPAWQIHSADLV